MNKIIIYQNGAIKLCSDYDYLFVGTIDEFRKKESKENIKLFKKILTDIIKNLDKNE